MAVNLSEKVDHLDLRMDSLESALGTFIISTNAALLRMERDTRNFKREMQEFKGEMREFKDEMREFKDEMSEFKDEMRGFKDEMRGFKDEMRGFKDEMREFKDEMREFKDESERDRKRMNKQWGDLANKMGTLVEDIVAPNIPRVAKEYFGIDDIDFFAVRVLKRNVMNPSIRKEFDAIAVSRTHFIFNDTKSTPRVNYIDSMIETRAEIYDWFPEYRDRKLIPIFSSLAIPEEIAKYLSRNRIFGMAMKDDSMQIVNFEEANFLCQKDEF